MMDWKKKLWLEQKTGQVYTRLKQYTETNLKQRPGEKKNKNNGIYNTYHGSLSQEWIDSDGEILIPALICNVNQSNE